MADPEFFQTQMGQRFYEGTMPRLVRAIQELADATRFAAAAQNRQPELEQLIREAIALLDANDPDHTVMNLRDWLHAARQTLDQKER